MAEALKNRYGPDVPQCLAEQIGAVYGNFDSRGFLAEVLENYADLDLMARGRRMAKVLRRFLPDSYPQALEILMASLGEPPDDTASPGLAPFFYLPHVLFVGEYGLEHFAESMAAQYRLTQRFTAEFSIRPFLERHPEATLAVLEKWAADPNVHVRRLVSEGTRSRLPWASRLRAFQRDPRPVLVLLELLKDDPELYVRRSVANNLNDIGKDHPDLLAATARAWLEDAPPQRRWLVRHALRSAVKRGEPGALAALGYAGVTPVTLGSLEIAPPQARQGGAVRIAFTLENHSDKTVRILVDLRIFFVKADGKSRPKVFKLKALELAPQQIAAFAKTVSLAELTTRKHYPGVHRVEALLNGRPEPLGDFEVVA